jgi:hypothetical protein
MRRLQEAATEATVSEARARVLMRDVVSGNAPDSMIARQLAAIAKWENKRQMVLEQERRKVMAVLMDRGLITFGVDRSQDAVGTGRLTVRGTRFGDYESNESRAGKNRVRRRRRMEGKREEVTYEEALKKASAHNARVDSELAAGVVANPYRPVPE